MKNHKLKLLNVAVLACFGVAAQQAMATTTVDISSGGTNTPLKIANEKTAPGTVAKGLANITVDAFSGLNTTAAPMTVRFDLIGGAKFSAAPSLYCKNTVGVTANGISTIVGGASNNNVTFQVKAPGNTALAATATCTLSGAFALSGVTPNKTVSATLSYSIGGTTTSHARSGGFVTFTKSVAAKFAAGGTVKVDATKSAQKFVSANSAVLLTAALGTITISAAAIPTAGAATAPNLSAGNTLTTAQITVTGPSLAAGFTSVSGQVFLVTATQSCHGGAGLITYSTKSGNSVTFKSVPLKDFKGGLKLCMSVNGKTAITTGSVTGSLTTTNATGFSVDTTASSYALTTVGTNGSSMNAYFINASNSTSKTSVIRIINTAGYTSTTLTATAYAEGGTVLGTAGASLGTVPANGMLTLTSAAIESKLGITGLAPTAKYRLVISSDMTSFKVVNFIQDVGTGAIHLAQQQDN